MNYVNAAALLLVAYLSAFLAACQTPLSEWPGVQIHLLPALMVYCGLTADYVGISLTAILGGLWFDALSANPLGITILPLFLVAFLVHLNRGLILREERYAQCVLGAMSSAAVPALSVVLLLGAGQTPLVGWGSIWHWSWMALVGGAATPALFWIFERFNRAFNYQPVAETSFRADRQIKRGRL